MALLLVTYELTSQEIDNDIELLEALECYSNIKLTASSCLIETKSSPKDVYRELRNFIHPNDTLLIFTVKAPWHGHGKIETIDWVSDKI